MDYFCFSYILEDRILLIIIEILDMILYLEILYQSFNTFIFYIHYFRIKLLPRGKNLDHTISERKENARKNRYNDIKACDATRVRLRRVPGDPNSSDYINANFIKVNFQQIFCYLLYNFRVIKGRNVSLLLKDHW